MQLKNFVYPLLFGAGTAAGIYYAGFTGGIITGSCGMLFIFVTLGKYLSGKAGDRMDASIKIQRKFYNTLKENE